jgi:hypothetical protein
MSLDKTSPAGIQKDSIKNAFIKTEGCGQMLNGYICRAREIFNQPIDDTAPVTRFELEDF